MAWTDRYVRADAAGGGDGTTNTNSGGSGAWTLAEGITNEAAGMRLNVLAGTYANTTTGRTFAAVGTTTQPIWWRGFKTAIGDQDSNNVAVAGTDIPAITFTTGQMVVSGAHHIMSNLDVSGACTTSGGQVNITGASCLFYRFRSQNTAANSAGRAASVNASAPCVLVACYLKATTTAAILVNMQAGTNSVFLGCTFTGGTIGINGVVAFTALGSVFDGQAGDAIAVLTGTVSNVINCSFYAPTGNGISFAATIAQNLIANNYFENVNQASKAAINNTSGTNTNLVRCVGNAYFNCTANTSGLGDAPLIFDNGTSAGAAFRSPTTHDFAVGPLLRAIGYPGTFENVSLYRGYSDVGAAQRQELNSGSSISF